MKVAVLTLCRDRIPYTRHCFGRLRELSGLDHDHYVLDQGSADGTWDWLEQWRHDDLIRRFVYRAVENLGIHRGLNFLLDRIEQEGRRYDAIVKIDNDCELLFQDTVRDVATLAVEGDALLSPRVQGLRHGTPAPIGEFFVDSDAIDETEMIGGIFLAAPAYLYLSDGYRFDETAPVWGTDDTRLCADWRATGRPTGYVRRLAVNHYETTDGQHDRFPTYFQRRVSEGGPE